MRKIILLLIILLVPLECNAHENRIQEQFEISGMSGILDVESEVFPDFDSREIVRALSEGEAFDSGEIINGVLNFFLQEFKNNLKICVLLLAIGFLTGVLSTMLSAYGSGASETGFFIAYCIFSGVLVVAFSEIISPAKVMIENVSVMVSATIPVLISMIAISGGVITSGLMTSGMVMLINIINSIISGIIFPLILCSFSLSVTANMSDKLPLAHTVITVRKMVKWMLLFVMAVFAGVSGVYGLSGSAIDASAGKAVRFAIGSGIPLVGGVAADSIETVIATLSATRNIIGTVGMCTVAVTAATPVIKTAVLMWIFRLCCAVIEPFSNPKIVKLMSDTAECISLVFSVLVSVCLLFIGALGVLLIAGNFVTG